jgi:hypothetical protein
MDNRTIQLTLNPTDGESRVIKIIGTADSLVSKIKGNWHVTDDKRTVASFEMTTTHQYEVNNLTISVEGQPKLVYDSGANLVIDNEGNIYFTCEGNDDESELLNFDIAASTGAFLEYFILKKDVQFIRGKQFCYVQANLIAIDD